MSQPSEPAGPRHGALVKGFPEQRCGGQVGQEIIDLSVFLGKEPLVGLEFPVMGSWDCLNLEWETEAELVEAGVGPLLLRQAQPPLCY